MWESCCKINHELRVVYAIDSDFETPLSTERSRSGFNTLPRRRGTFRCSDTYSSIPPLVIILGMGEQIPDALRRCVNSRNGTRGKCHCLILSCIVADPESHVGWWRNWQLMLTGAGG
jgi:hypothetical protein